MHSNLGLKDSKGNAVTSRLNQKHRLMNRIHKVVLFKYFELLFKNQSCDGVQRQRKLTRKELVDNLYTN